MWKGLTRPLDYSFKAHTGRTESLSVKLMFVFLDCGREVENLEEASNSKRHKTN